MDTLRAAVRHRRGLVMDRKAAQQRLHDQLNALCPGLSAPAGHGRSLPVASPTGRAVLACAAAFAGRPPRVRSLIIRAPGRITPKPPPTTASIGGEGVYPRPQMLSNGPGGWPETWTAQRICKRQLALIPASAQLCL